MPHLKRLSSTVPLQFSLQSRNHPWGCHIADVLGETSPKNTVGSLRRGDFQPMLAKHPNFPADLGAREQSRLSLPSWLC